MDYASEELTKEHEAIVFGLRILAKVVSLLREKSAVHVDDVVELVDFFHAYADVCHHGKEECLLFPAMEAVGIQKKDGPIAQMLHEHDEGRRYLAQMKEASGALDLGREAFIHSAGKYMSLLLAHIDKEDKILFPMGDAMIPPERQATLLESFEVFEDKALGAGTHEKLSASLQVLMEKYEV